MRLPKKNLGAITLSELLIVVVLIGILLIYIGWNWQNQINRGYDARRKSDLSRIKIAFEDYYNDHECYPEETILEQCGGSDLVPYMGEIPCDPVSRDPYVYIPDDPDGCSGYRILAALQDTSDPDIGKVGCNTEEGCGYYDPSYNYGISAGGPVYSVATSPEGPGYACTPGQYQMGVPVPGTSNCNNYLDPDLNGCPRTYTTSNCNGQCMNPANWCES